MKTLRQHEKLLVTSNFSSSLNVVYRIISLNTCPTSKFWLSQIEGIHRKNIPWVFKERTVNVDDMKNIERKGEIARNEQILLFSQCFL